MPCARCSMCGRNFPVSLIDEDCPVCGLDQLAGFRDGEPDDPEELRSAVVHAQFERYLEQTGRA